MKNINLQYFIYKTAAVGFFLFLLLGFSFYFVYFKQTELYEEQQAYLYEYKLADELRQTSDDQTRFARLFVATGNERFARYYTEVVAIRNGTQARPEKYEMIYWDLLVPQGQKPRPDRKATAWQDLVRKSKLDQEAQNLLYEAEKQCNNLMFTELTAINAAQGLFDDGKGNFVIKKETDFSLAKRLLFDQGYLFQKSVIMRSLDKYFDRIEKKNTENTLLHENQISYGFLGIFSGVFGIMGLLWYSVVNLRNGLILPLQEATKQSTQIAEGEILQEKIKTAHLNSMIHDLLKAISQIKLGISHKADFVEAVSAGNLNSHYEPAGQKDSLGFALVKMQTNLQEITESERKRNWANSGIADFAETLRNIKELEPLCEQALSKLIKYLSANQGGIFVQFDTSGDAHLRLVAAYAYERKKFLQKRVELGEGLVGQIFLEGETLNIVEVPENYLTITSGLGEALPKNILLVPMKNSSQQTIGVLELANFRPFEPYEVEFVEKVAEIVGSNILDMKRAIKVQKLLQESQLQAQNLRTQEEEMRQNVEELMAMHEELQRKEVEYKEKIVELETQLANINPKNPPETK